MGSAVRYFHWVAVAMVVVGVVGAVSAVALRFDPLLVLIGAMLVISGAVKLVMLRMWRDLPPSDRATRPALWRR